MADLQVDEEAVGAAAARLRLFAQLELAVDPADHVRRTACSRLIDAAAQVGAEHRRAAAALRADASRLAEALDGVVAQLHEADRLLAHTSRAKGGSRG